MSSRFYIKQGSTRPKLRIQILNDGEPRSLADVSSVTLTVENLVSNAPMTIVDAENGVVEYVWQAGDTAVQGSHRGDIQVTFNDGGIAQWPDPDYLEVIVNVNI